MIDAYARERCLTFVGRRRVLHDTIAPEPLERLAVVLGRPAPDGFVPPLWHWAYFNAAVAEVDRNEDLHERPGIFLPPAPFPARMRAGGDITVHRPLAIGVPARLEAEVETVDFKEGRAGEMCFVTVRHRISQADTLCIDETQTLVYRNRTTPEAALRQPDEPVPDGYVVYSDGTLLFYSAITFNGHRIHWDRHFCRDVEGYPDLVVHGPLMATDLCDAMRDGLQPCRLTYRAKAPVYATTPVRLVIADSANGREGRVERVDGVTAVTATLSPL